MKTFLRMSLFLIGMVVLMPLHAQTSVNCEAILEIWEIQGSAAEANCVGERVTTTDNIVTAIGPNGFFIQTPDARIDDDPTTSNGLYVYTDRHPGLWDVQVGDSVTVEGRVEEEFYFTRIEAPTQRRVSILSSGNPLPQPIDLLAVDLTPAEVHPLERYEGMLVSVEDAFINAGTNQFDEFGISLTGERALREAGIEPDDLVELAGTGLPEWDLNPEVVEVDPAEMGMEVLQVPTGGRATVTGGLAYSFLDYQIWTTSLVVEAGNFATRPARAPEAGEFTIATQNVLNLFDTIDDPNRDDDRFEDWTPIDEEAYQRHLMKQSAQIRINLSAPDILAIQEIENLRVMNDLAIQIFTDDPSLRYVGCLLEGNEGRGIDVGFLVRTDRVNIHDCYRLPGSETALYNDGDFVFTRPPLVMEAELLLDGEAFPLTLINLHLRSLSGVETDRVQLKRLLQATMVAEYVQTLQNDNPNINLVVLGDLNAFQFTDGLVDVVGIIAGNHDYDGARTSPEFDYVEPDLVNQVLRLPADEQYSFIWNSNPQVLDHILTSQTLDALVTDIQYARGNADAPVAWFDTADGALRSSDHDGLVLYIRPE